MQQLFHQNQFGFTRQCTYSDALPRHFGNVALLLSYPQFYEFSSFISGTMVREAGIEDRDERCIHLPSRDLSLMFTLSYRELLMLDEILSQTMMMIEIDKLLSD